MKLCYQVATPDVKIAETVTAFQGPLEESFRKLSQMGYDGVELMTLDPGRLDREGIRELARGYGLDIVLVCTGEICGQLGLTYTDPDPARRCEAIERTKSIIDFASYLGAGLVNIGRIRGQYLPGVPREQTEETAIEAFREISGYAAERDVVIALENVTRLQTNFINTVEEAADMARRVGRANFRIMMDVFHMNIEERSITGSIRRHAGMTVHVHLADRNRRSPGQCGMDFSGILNEFRASGYDGAFCAEIWQLPDQETAARETAQFLRPLLDRVYGAD